MNTAPVTRRLSSGNGNAGSQKVSLISSSTATTTVGTRTASQRRREGRG